MKGQPSSTLCDELWALADLLKLKSELIKIKIENKTGSYRIRVSTYKVLLPLAWIEVRRLARYKILDGRQY